MDTFSKQFASIPMKEVGPISIKGINFHDLVHVPLATFESPLWFSVARGARISRLGEGIQVLCLRHVMSRSIILEASSMNEAYRVLQEIKLFDYQSIIDSFSRFTRFESLHAELVGRLMYLRFSFQVGDAAGHNMVTLAAEKIAEKLVDQFHLCYISVSGNICTDKKNSSINGILGRGRHVMAEMIVPKAICHKQLRTSPQQLVDLHIKKNLIGSILAGSVRSANAHFANMLLAFYLATGQDAANIVEGSQGMVHAEMRGEDLYFVVSLPNVIVGVLAQNKFDFVKNNLEKLGCLPNGNPGESADRLAMIIGATVWCGELSLLAAQTNSSELMRSHLLLERFGRKIYD